MLFGFILEKEGLSQNDWSWVKYPTPFLVYIGGDTSAHYSRPQRCFNQQARRPGFNLQNPCKNPNHAGAFQEDLMASQSSLIGKLHANQSPCLKGDGWYS